MAEKREDKKQKKSTNTSQNRPNPVTRYFRETRGELRKVVWPTRQESTRLTGIVVAVTAVMTTVLFSFDFLFSNLLQWVVDQVVL